MHNLPVYNFHSPDTNFGKKPLNVDRAYIPWEIFGPGQRYGIYAEGELSNSFFDAPANHRGFRGSVNLNHYTTPTVLEVPEECGLIMNMVIEVDLCDLDIFKGKASNFLVAGMTVSNNLQGGKIISMELNIFTTKLVATKKSFGQTTVFIRQQVGHGFPPSVSVEGKIIYEQPNGGRCEYYYKGLTKTIFVDNRHPEDAECQLIWDDKLVSLNYKPPEYTSKPLIRCIKDVTYIGTDEILDQVGKFTYPIDNSYREKSVYLELEGTKLGLENNIDRFLSDGLYNGYHKPGTARTTTADGTADASLLGDIECHSCPIHFGAAHYAVLLNDDPKQYGRLENAAYIRLGMELTMEELLLERVVRVGIGNRWMGMYHHRRFGYMTDKVGEFDHQAKRTSEPITVFDTWLASWTIDTMPLLCAYDCSEIPIPCSNDNDPRKKNGLREFGHVCWDGVTPFPGLTNRDKYHPHTFNMLTHFWVESEINLWHRQSGVCETIPREFLHQEPKLSTAEVFYPELQCLKLDPVLPLGTSWTKAFLPRYGIRWVRIPGLKKFIRTFLKVLINIFFFFVVMYLFMTLSGSTITAFIAIGLAVVALLMMSEADRLQMRICRLLDKILDIDPCVFYCFPDKNGGGGLTNCKEEDSKLLPIEENYTAYNRVLSFMNKLEFFLGYGLEYDTCICKTPTNLLYYSDEQNLESPQDAFQNYRPNNYSELDVKHGLITDLFEWGTDLYAQTSDQVLRLYSVVDQLQTGNGREIILGSGKFLNRAVPIAMNVPEGWGGNIDVYASKSSKFGRFYVDRQEGSIIAFNGKPVPISNQGLREFMKENLALFIVEQFPHYEQIGLAVNFIGYSIGFDPRLNRMLITKIDYKALNPDIVRFEDNLWYKLENGQKTPIRLGDTKYFINTSFTVSYNLVTNAWISWHTYFPSHYMNDRKWMYSLLGNKVYRHSSARTFLNFYGVQNEWIIDINFRMPNFMAFQFSSLMIDSESAYYIDDLPVRGDQFFTHIGSWNSYQSTGMAGIEIIGDTVSDTKKNGQFIFHRLLHSTGKMINKVETGDKVQILVRPKDLPGILYNLNSLIVKEKAQKADVFFDKYQGIRLICDKSSPTGLNIILKFVTLDGTIPY